MTGRKRKLSIRFLTLVLAGLVALNPIVSEAQVRQRNLVPGNVNSFFENYCLRVNVHGGLGDISGLFERLTNLTFNLELFFGRLLDIDLKLNPPKLCIPDLNFDLGGINPEIDMSLITNLQKCLSGSVNFGDWLGSIGSLGNLQQCMPQMPTINFNLMNGCLVQLGNLGVDLGLQMPSIDTDSIQQCLNGLQDSLDNPIELLVDITGDIGSVVAGFNDFLRQLRELVADFRALLNPDFQASIEWLGTFCGDYYRPNANYQLCTGCRRYRTTVRRRAVWRWNCVNCG